MMRRVQNGPQHTHPRWSAPLWRWLLSVGLAIALPACLETEFREAPSVDAFADSATADGVDASSDATSTCVAEAGCACSAHAECKSGACLPTQQGKRCASFCVAGECPADATCGAVLVEQADGTKVNKFGLCVPKWPTDCMPCATDEACQLPGAMAHCVDPSLAGSPPDIGTGHFCAAACTSDSDCGPERVCQARLATSGSGVKVCVPTSGVCTCSPLAIALNAKTPCGKTAPNFGTCKGFRYCQASGLTACFAAPPTAEVCNGVDDDCNGAIDDAPPTKPLCADDNPCTEDSCKSSAGCVFAPLTTPCNDGDVCTGDDACKDGKCVGQSVGCDDGNPCTVDVCEPESGCSSSLTNGACSDGDQCTINEQCDGGKCGGGQPVACSDDNPCTSDWCDPAQGCVYVPADGPCVDGNACTGLDTCVAGKCTGAPLVCDDGWGCTADSCDAVDGCTFLPSAQGACGLASLPYGAQFACGDEALAQWQLSAPGISVANPQPPPVAWHLDATPALGGSADCSLNVNNGQTLGCGVGQANYDLTATSPWMDAKALTGAVPLILRMDSAGFWGSQQVASVQVRGDGAPWTQVASVPATGTTWSKLTINLTPWVGQLLQIRLRFQSPDCSDNTSPGWFVRNVTVAEDPCAANNGGCAAIATCTAVGNVAQCACKPGFWGDGKKCFDVDECADGSAGCMFEDACLNTPGSFTCGCPFGYEGDGINCNDIDECALGTAGCSPNAGCVNTPGSAVCTCKPGYTGDGKQCSDVEECALAGTCAAQATCTNLPGSFQCACKAGFAGDGKTCADIDECAAGTLTCAANAKCVNASGTASCVCNPGYVGDGKTCDLYGSQAQPAPSCKAIRDANPAATDGKYWLALAGQLVQVPCDMTTDGGGWTVIEYKSDLVLNKWGSASAFIWLASDLATVLSAAQIQALQAVSKEGRQTWFGLCNRMVHYQFVGTGGYERAFGFRFLDGTETSFAKASYAPYSISVPQDGCKGWGNESGDPAKATIFEISSLKVPVVNVKFSQTNYAAVKFGAPLTKYPARLR